MFILVLSLADVQHVTYSIPWKGTASSRAAKP